MRYYRWRITFETGQVEIVHAKTEDEAVILAQALQINKGNSPNVKQMDSPVESSTFDMMQYAGTEAGKLDVIAK